MKNFRIISLLFSVLFVMSCKNENDVKDAEKVEDKKVLNDFFEIKLDVKGKKDNTFHVYYTEDKSLNFDEKHTVWAEFENGSAENLKVVYKLPNDVLPNQLRLDFGINNIDGVSIENIEITYLDKTLNIKGAEISSYFRPNELCTVYDSTANVFKPLKKGDNISLYPIEKLPIELEKLFK
ncbi:hypothetical protein [Flavobacterium celericrescens]|jgi:hypothetical protein|uniref:Lipoprotein n=1 Tax=Flavobacterium celericrescens TaxID=2709780 RepID=A0ABX0I8B4_9FLAO|nr:hypothetical protein [Flavobacterium celericrescens]NHM03423.1 hypothetical protein [Flavobacterium celericrescens]